MPLHHSKPVRWLEVFAPKRPYPALRGMALGAVFGVATLIIEALR